MLAHRCWCRSLVGHEHACALVLEGCCMRGALQARGWQRWRRPAHVTLRLTDCLPPFPAHSTTHVRISLAGWCRRREWPHAGLLAAGEVGSAVGGACADRLHAPFCCQPVSRTAGGHALPFDWGCRAWGAVHVQPDTLQCCCCRSFVLLRRSPPSALHCARVLMSDPLCCSWSAPAVPSCSAPASRGPCCL